MQMLISLLLAIALGYRAKQKGREGLKFGAGVAVALLIPLSVLQFWSQVDAVHPALWWVIAAFVTFIAWTRLDKPNGVTVQTGPMLRDSPEKAMEAASIAATDTHSRPKPWSMEEIRHLWAGQMVHVKKHPVKGWLRIIGGGLALIYVLALAIHLSVRAFDGLAGLSEANPEQHVGKSQSSAGFSNNLTLRADSVSAAQLETATATRLPEEMPIVSWKDQGYGFSARTRVFFKTDTFGKITKASVDQLGLLSTSGQIHPIPKFALKYHADSSQGDILLLVSFNGPGKPVRLSFDGDNDYIELMPNDGDLVSGRMSGKVARGMQSANTLKVLHGASATGGELSFQYDLAELRRAVGLALAALGTTPTGVVGANSPQIADIAPPQIVQNAPTQQEPRQYADRIPEDRAIAFAKRWFDEGSTATGAVDLLPFYSSAVDYYKKGVVDRNFIIDDKARFIKRWPIRRNVMGEIGFIGVGDKGEARLAIPFTWEVESATQSKRGNASIELSIQDFDGQLLIVKESGG